MLKATMSMPSPVTAVDWSPKETGRSGAQVVAVGTEAGDVALFAASSSDATVWNKLVAPARWSHLSIAPRSAPRFSTLQHATPSPPDCPQELEGGEERSGQGGARATRRGARCHASAALIPNPTTGEHNGRGGARVDHYASALAPQARGARAPAAAGFRK